LGSNSVYALYKDKRGNLWIGTWEGGLNLFDYKTESFRRFLSTGKPGSISSNNVYTILEDSRGNLWIGTLGGGLNRYDYTTNTFKHYLPKEGDSLSRNLMTRYVNQVYETTDGKLLISTYNSVDLYNPESDDFTHYIYTSSAGKKIVTIFEDSKKNIWLGTNNGIFILDLKDGVVKPYQAARDYTDLTIQAIQEDLNGNLWLSSNDGIFALILAVNLPDSLSIRHFSRIDGLPENEFIKRSTYKDSRGMLYFGSVGGYTYFNPDSIFTNDVIPRVILTEFQLLVSQKDKGNKYIPIKGNINYIEEIELPYKDRNFTIQFAALSYLHPEENQYQYMLEGYDEGWIDVGNQKKATYTNIQAGKYTFKVKACNNDGVWCEQPKTIKIIIHPPLWGTIWFRALVIIIVIVLFIFFYRLRFAYLELQRKLLEEKIKERTAELLNMNTLLEEKQEEITVQNAELEKHRNNLETIVEERTSELIRAKLEAEESNRLKSSFLANMSHEIRTPMNAISGFSGLLIDESYDKAEKERFISNINKNCDTLKVLIDDIIDISLIEANQLKIIKNHFEVDPILYGIESYFSLANDKDIQFKFVENHDVKNITLDNDVIRFRQILNNLISNAYKYTEKGSISFGYEMEKDFVRFYVSDTGIGIEKSEQEKIFHSFYKVENDPNTLYRGAGIGLAICQRLVTSMGGHIWVHSENNKGSTFYFTLPITKVMQPAKNQSVFDLSTILPKLQNMTVLVAEDEPSNFDLVNVLLRRYVLKVEWAKNGIEAVEFIKANPRIENCVVLMDIKMPTLDGYEAHKQIREINPQIPVIAVTAFALSSDKQRLMNEQFDAFIFKPIKKEILIETVAKFASQTNS
jgi:signal transduction histidine kinase/CheY-like chemotaxis protein